MYIVQTGRPSPDMSQRFFRLDRQTQISIGSSVVMGGR